MNFHIPWILQTEYGPPLFFPIFCPDIRVISNPIISISPTNSNGAQMQIIVTREDLQQEGYEQSKRPWTEEEDKLLMNLCSNPNAYFEDIATHLPGRNSKMCYSRFRRLTNKSKKYWTKAEDEKLKTLIESSGVSTWKEMEAFFPGRNFKQLKEHYENFLQPNLDKKQWTIEEDLQLIELINKEGQRWKYIQELMPHRSCSQLKNRFFGRIKRLNDKKIAARGQTQNKEISLTY